MVYFQRQAFITNISTTSIPHSEMPSSIIRCEADIIHLRKVLKDISDILILLDLDQISLDLIAISYLNSWEDQYISYLTQHRKQQTISPMNIRWHISTRSQHHMDNLKTLHCSRVCNSITIFLTLSESMGTTISSSKEIPETKKNFVNYFETISCR